MLFSAFAGVTAVSGQAAAVNVGATDWSEFQNDTRNTGNNSNVAGPVTDTTQRWNKATLDSVSSSPAVVADTVYVGSDDGNLYAINATNGSQRWFTSVGPAVASSPAVANDTVYVGSNDTNLYALNATDGSERWSATTGGNIDSAPTVVNDTVYVGSDDGTLYAVNATDGSERWSNSTGSDINTAPAVANDTVYFGSDDGTWYALNATDGSERWTVSVGGAVHSSPAVVNDRVYAGADDGTVYALNATDGSEHWSNTIDTNGRVRSSPAVDDNTDTVYVGADNGLVFALNGTASNGSSIWNTTTGGTVTSSPALVGETVYVGSDGGSVRALDANDGTERWRHRIGVPVRSSPAVTNSTVYVGADDGNVYALGKPATINGTLTDTNDDPVQGVDVEFGYANPAPGEKLTNNLRQSDSNGDYSFVVPDATRNYEIIINSQSYTFVQESPIAVANNQTTTRDITLVEGGLINGTVTDTNGNPISGVKIETYNDTSGEGVRNSQPTDSNGDYSVRVEGGNYEVVLNDPNYELGFEDNLSVTNGSTTRVDFQLAEQAGTGFINGTVEDSDGNPVQGANVFGRDSSFTNFPGALTDGAGEFSLESSQGEYFVRVQKAGFPPVVREDVNITENQTTDISVTLREPAYINGTVTNASGSAPTGSFVIAQTEGDIIPGKIAPSTGEYNLTVPPGTHQVSVFSPNGTVPSESVSVSGGEVNTKDFQLVNTTILHDSVEKVSGSGTGENLGIRTALRRGLLQAQVVDETDPKYNEGRLGPPSELEAQGVDSTTELRINITVTNYSANSLLWGLDNANFSTSSNETAGVDNATDITITGSPATLQVNLTNEKKFPLGPLIDKDPSEIDLPQDENDQATNGRNQTVYIGVFDLSTVPGEARDTLSGVSVTTNAQTFSIPSLQNNTLRLFQAAPSLTVGGNEHTGFYQADIPQDQLDSWNVSDPESELSISYKNQPREATVTDTDDGARIRIENISYSGGFVDVQANPPTDDSGDSTSTSPGSDDAGAGGVGSSQPSQVTTQQTATGTEATIEQVTIDDPTVTVSTEATTSDGVSVGEVSATFEKASNTENTMSVSASSSPPSGTPDPPDTDTVLGYVDVTVEGSLADSISEGRFTVDVSGQDVDPAAVTAQRYDGSGWQDVETEPVGDSTVEVISPDGYSAFAIGASEAAEPEEATTTPTDDESDTPAGDTQSEDTPAADTPSEDTPAETATPGPDTPAQTPTPTEAPGVFGPGFGIVAALLAVIAALGALRLRRP